MFTKPFYKSKVFWFNLAVGVFDVAQRTVIDAGVPEGWLLTVLTVGNMALRAVTKSAVTLK